jgi:hypothetical protein
VAAQNFSQHGLPAFSDYATVIHYGRYSSAKQAAGTSEERQLDKADQWAAREGVVFTDRLIDRGKSGFHGKHRTEGDFGTLLQQVKDSLVTTPALLVLVEGDRAGREDVDVQLESLVLGLLRGGVDLFIVDAGLHLNLERWRADIGAQIQLQAILHGANQYSRRLSARMQDAHARGRRKIASGEIARPGWAPSWIDLRNGRWELNSYATTIKRMLELVHDQGYNATAQRLTGEGHRPPRGKMWTQGSVRSLVQSEAIAGGRVPLRRDPSSVVWDYFPALMPRLEWQALLARIAARDGAEAHGGNQNNVNFIGMGVTFCVACGRPAGGRVSSYKQRSTGNRIQQRYVRCRGVNVHYSHDGEKKVRTERACDAPALPLRVVHAHLLTRLSLAHLGQLFPQTQESELGALQSKIDALQQRLEEQRAVAANGQQQIASLLATAPDAVPVVAQAVAEAKQKVEALELELHQARTAHRAMESDAQRQLGREVAAAASDMLKTFWREEDTVEQRRQINQLLRKLDIRISIDAKRRQIGLSVGDGGIEWQPLASVARLRALEEGHVKPVLAYDTPGVGSTLLTREGDFLHQPASSAPQLSDAEREEVFLGGYDQAVADLEAIKKEVEAGSFRWEEVSDGRDSPEPDSQTTSESRGAE